MPGMGLQASFPKELIDSGYLDEPFTGGGSHIGRVAASYQEPIEYSIAQIPTILTTMHNEAVIGWKRLRIDRKAPAVLFHIDRHADMDAGVPTWENMERLVGGRKEGGLSFGEYVKDYVAITNFIAYAIHEGIVGVVYWWNPKEDQVTCYGRIREGRHVAAPTTVEPNGGGSIYWDEISANGKPSYYEYKRKETISLQEFIHDLRGYKGPSILDWDLDSITSIEDPEWNNGGNDTRELERNRILLIGDVVGQLPRPTGISLTSSQYPKVFVPPNKVERFTREAGHMLEMIYDRQEHSRC